VSVGLDTSVVLRLLTGQPAKESVVARRRLEQAVSDGESILVTDLVLGEAYFALHYHYGVTKRDAREQILAMLRSNVVTASPPESIHAFEATDGAGVVDRLIHERHHALQAVTLTFDRKMAALEGAVRLSSR
jgi:predicted nucleic acid-binding protein